MLPARVAHPCEEVGMNATDQPAPAPKPTGEQRLAKLLGLRGETWMRHANPVSVWTRFAVLPLLAASIWSRDWIAGSR
jgi:hypothetical protein